MTTTSIRIDYAALPEGSDLSRPDAIAEVIKQAPCDSGISAGATGFISQMKIELPTAHLGAASPTLATVRKPAPTAKAAVTPFPKGPFRFFALDVETANNDRGSICQIGVACVRPDNSIETWVTYVDPQVDRWVFSYLHGISARTIKGAPTFAEVLPVLQGALTGQIVYQHSGFDRSAVAAACGNANLPIPQWDWRDSVHIARAAWPELRGNGGHGLGSLKLHLGLVFDHHDAGEDARAAAEVVLCAEGRQPAKPR